MTKQKNRINLTLDDELYATITAIAELSGQPKASLIADLLGDLKPHLDMTIDFHRQIKENKMKLSDARRAYIDMLANTGDIIQQVQGDLNNAFKEINQETDEELDNVASRRKGNQSVYR